MQSSYRHELNVYDIVPFGEKSDRGFYALTLEKPKWGTWQPGQFVMVRPLSWGQELTWARPFSICRVTNKYLIIFFQAIGRGTKRLSQLKPQDKVLVWGPLGTHFAMEDRKTLLIAGGIGVAPFVGYTHHHPNPSQISMIFSHRAPMQCYPVDSLSPFIKLDRIHEQNPEDLQITLGKIRHQMLEIKENKGVVLACGPMPLLRYIWKCAKEFDVPTQLSLEQRMACGVGACLGCVATSSESFVDKEKAGLPVQTCTYGPVFWADSLNLAEEEQGEKEKHNEN